MKLFEDGDPCFAPQLNALFAAFRGTAVMAGCEASATGTSRVVSIAAGQVQINGNAVNVGSGSVTLDAGSTFDRYDLVSVDASGSKIVTKGTTKRKCPTQPANTCLLAIVFVPAGATVIATGNVYDARMLSQNLAAAAIECAGAIRNQTGNIGARSQFVDVPGTTTTRKSSTISTTLSDGVWTQLLTVTVPATYSATENSNARIRISISGAPWAHTYPTLNGRVTRNGEVIGTGTATYPGDANPITGVSFDTTGGFVAGDVLVVEARWNAEGTEYTSVTATEVAIMSTRSTEIAAKKEFVEEGAW